MGFTSWLMESKARHTCEWDPKQCTYVPVTQHSVVEERVICACISAGAIRSRFVRAYNQEHDVINACSTGRWDNEQGIICASHAALYDKEEDSAFLSNTELRFGSRNILLQ